MVSLWTSSARCVVLVMIGPLYVARPAARPQVIHDSCGAIGRHIMTKPCVAGSNPAEGHPLFHKRDDASAGRDEVGSPLPVWASFGQREGEPHEKYSPSIRGSSAAAEETSARGRGHPPIAP